MTHRCHFCEKAAFAYLIESDGSRTYLCLEHFPQGETPIPGDHRPPRGPAKPDDTPSP